MSLKIIRNDITKMDTEAIVNTANEDTIVGDGCDRAVYIAAGQEDLLRYRRDHIGKAEEGDAFITPGFRLKAKYIIHAVSPFYMGGKNEEERKLHACYRNSLNLAAEYGIRSIAFPLIATGSFGYPREEGIRIAVDEIRAFLQNHEMEVYLVVFDETSTRIGSRMNRSLEAYIDRNYVEERFREEYTVAPMEMLPFPVEKQRMSGPEFMRSREDHRDEHLLREEHRDTLRRNDYEEFEMRHERRLSERIQHIADSFSEYLQYLIARKHMDNATVYKNAIVDKKVFSKIKNNPEYHPQKLTALCLCVGAQLNLDETKDLLARAGYALSPCDKTDIIFSYFIENRIYDMIEIDIQLEEHGLPCIIK